MEKIKEFKNRLNWLKLLSTNSVFKIQKQINILQIKIDRIPEDPKLLSSEVIYLMNLYHKEIEELEAVLNIKHLDNPLLLH